ncbi:hypothetical protein WICMUC_005786 [Wickerhamomyces mucosus]|uniref:Transcription initiation factor TFIID subunit 10 n=1 Tax=Wickerhamomyces mucosus TaxID=1378264 RepID=A0A9P8T423_9ASCO|nr:hypothetical protein WICMUC_005786 [Wickerhamomyces mucosus]
MSDIPIKNEDVDMDVDVEDELFDDNVESQQVEKETHTGGEVADEKKRRDVENNEHKEDEGESENVETKSKPKLPSIVIPELPEFTKKDKTIHEILEMMEDYYPIIPDSVTDYYLSKNGLDCDDVRIKRILALATQKFINDIATDAYEYSRIRSQSTVYNSSNPQVRAKALMAGAINGQQTSTSNSGNSSKKVVLTTEDLSSALSEYGLNISRPDFYR